MRQSKVNKDCQFYYSDKDKWEGYAFFNQGNDNKDCYNGNCVDNLKVMVCGFNHILHAGSFSDKHSLLIVFLADFKYFIQLIVNRITCYVILGINKNKSPVIAFKHVR